MKTKEIIQAARRLSARMKRIEEKLGLDVFPDEALDGAIESAESVMEIVEGVREAAEDEGDES